MATGVIMNRLKIQHYGFFEGDFVVTTKDCSFSIGDYIEVILKEPPYLTGEVIKTPDGEGNHIIAFPLTVTECCHIDKIEVILRLIVGSFSFKHWSDCLTIDRANIVISYKYQFKNYTWYMPKIDGWIRNMSGKVKSNRLRSS